VSVTSPAGFRASGVTAGIKASGRPDIALVVNDGPLAVAAGVFTANRFAAAPVLWSRQVVADGEVRAVILNSGGANACTGPEGFADTHRTAEHVAAALDAAGFSVGAGDVAVCSTGLIGERLPMEKLLAGVDAAVVALPHLRDQLVHARLSHEIDRLHRLVQHQKLGLPEQRAGQEGALQLTA